MHRANLAVVPNENCTRDMHKAPPPNIEVDIWHPAVGLKCRITPMHLCHIKV